MEIRAGMLSRSFRLVRNGFRFFLKKLVHSFILISAEANALITISSERLLLRSVLSIELCVFDITLDRHSNLTAYCQMSGVDDTASQGCLHIFWALRKSYERPVRGNEPIAALLENHKTGRSRCLPATSLTTVQRAVTPVPESAGWLVVGGWCSSLMSEEPGWVSSP